MSKAKYHVPQPGELVEFQNAGGLREKVIVSKWDSKHGIITSIGAAKYQVGDRSTIKLVPTPPSAAPKIGEPSTQSLDTPRWVDAKVIKAEAETKRNGDIALSVIQIPSSAPAPVAEAPRPRPRTEEHLFREPVAVSTEFTVRLPTSFASEVARAKVIADAEAENKKRHEAEEVKCDELADKIAALVNERCEIIREDENAQHDFENRLEYLRSLRIRQGK